MAKTLAIGPVEMETKPKGKWCLDSGLKISQSMNRMTLVEYEEPVAKWLPSINF
ncbi:MAG: hypothetical protein ACI87E_003431 [Mariniblastus sp.]|jgi:hypothetical protein